MSHGIGVCATVTALFVSGGCQRDGGGELSVLPPLARDRAEEIVNANALRIDGTLRAMGSVDGTAIDAKGVTRSFSLDGILFYRPPSYLRFDLKKFGDRQLLIGCNEDGYWVFSKDNGKFRCGVHGDDTLLPEDFPIQPLQLLDALGLRPIADGVDENVIGRTQRIEGRFQQVLFLVRDASGAITVEKEYWLDRVAPRLVRQIVFRDGIGKLEMKSMLGNYRHVDAGGPLLPFKMEADWPGAGLHLTFSISKWSMHPTIGPDGPQFATPLACQENGP